MSEPNSAPDATPEVPKAPSFTYGDAAPAAPAAPAASSPLPPPQYGERMPDYAAAPAYTPAPDYAASPAYGAPVQGHPYGPPAPRRRTWDLVLTIVLLVTGFFGMLMGIGVAYLFTDPAFSEQFNEQLGQQGISGDIDFGSFPTIIVVSHVLLYLIALGLSILLLVKRKIAFYVPLSAGVIATLVFWIGYLAVVFSSVDMNQFGR
jgi:hypothetical protein